MRLIGMMKSSLVEKEEILSTTPYVKNISDLPAKENSYLFNHISKLAADHDVSVSSTMIKVTYKKALKDQYTYCNGIQNSNDSALVEDNMNLSLTKTYICSKKNKNEGSGFMLLPKNVKWKMVKRTDCDSSTKQNKEPPIKRKKNHFNGLSVLKVNNLSNKSEKALQRNPLKMPRPKATPLPGNQINNKKGPQVGKVKIKSDTVKNNNVEKKRSQKISIKNGTLGKNKKGEKKVRSKKTEVNCESVKKKPLNSREKIKKVKVSEESLTKGGKIEKSMGKKPILFVDPDLPSGWSRYIRVRDKGSPIEKHIVYVVSPQGKKFRYKWKLRKYLNKTNSNLDAGQFFFGLYKRGKSANVPEKESKKKPEVILSPAKAKSSTLVTGNSCGNGTIKKVPKIVRSGQKSGNDKNQSNVSVDGKELLLYDPDLPFRWKRIIHSNSSDGKLQVHIVSPEGKIFRRKGLLAAYLKKHQCTHNLDRFYFGLYPKKDSIGAIGTCDLKKTCRFNKSSGDAKGLPKTRILSTKPDVRIKKEENELSYYDSTDDEGEENSPSKKVVSQYEDGNPMHHDPNLPEGWRRYINTQSSGETVGKMEVVIVSPDGRRHKTRRRLEHYLKQHNQNYKAEDFDLSVFGNSKKRPLVPESTDLSFSVNKKFKPLLIDKPDPNFDVTSLKEQEAALEGQLIDAVSGLMIACNLSTARSERRSRLPRSEHEMMVRKHLECEGDLSSNGCDIPAYFIQRFAMCRSDLRTLESDAVSAIAEKTKDFIKEISQRAFQSSRHPEKGLQYEDVAEIVQNSKCLSPLKTLIPQKITYKECLRLNRAKQFLSFT